MRASIVMFTLSAVLTVPMAARAEESASPRVLEVIHGTGKTVVFSAADRHPRWVKQVVRLSIHNDAR